MKSFNVRSGLTALAAAALLLLPVSLQAKTVKLTGQVSDTMCGAKHEMAGSPAKCTRGCVKMGSGYALVVGGKVYKLAGASKAATKTLWDQAGKNVTISGDLSGDTVTVKSVSAAK